MSDNPLQDVLNQAMFYRAFEGQMLALGHPSGFGKPNFYSSDGVHFYELSQTGYGNGSFNYDDPHRSVLGEIKYYPKGNFWELHEAGDDFPVFRSAPTPDQIIATPLPIVREPVQLFFRGETYILVSTEKYRRLKYKLFFGRLPTLTPLLLLESEPSSRFTTPSGILKFGDKARWEGCVFEELRLADFDIVETEDHVFISSRQ